MLFTVKATCSFTDVETKLPVKPGDLVTTESEERARNIIRRNLGKLAGIRVGDSVRRKKTGKQIVVYQNLLYKIGGIETADYNLARAFPHKKITFIFRNADFDQALRLARFHDVLLDDGKMDIKCDVLILANYDSYPWIKGRVKARKIYQQVHADWANMKKLRAWRDFRWAPDPDVDVVVACSKTAAKALKTAFKRPIPSKTVCNIVLPLERPCRTFLSLTRLTSEKGADRIVQCVRLFHNADKDFLWIIAATESDSGIRRELQNDPSVVFLEPGVNRQSLVGSVDVVVQLSDNESFCYTVHEALMAGTPCLCTRIPEFEKVIKHGENGWLVDLDLHDLDIEAIFGELPHPKPTTEKIDPAWEDLLAGKL